MVNVKRAIFSGLILGLIYKLPCRVNFDSMHYSTLFWKVFQKDSDSSQSFEITFLPAHVHVSSPYATYQLQPSGGNTPVCQNGHKSLQQPLSPWLLSAADKLDSAAGMHLIFTRCEGAPGAWFIAGPQPHDIINTVTISGNNKSVQQSRLLSSLTWWVQVFPEKTQSSQFAATNDTSSKVTVTAWIPLILLLSLKKPYIENIFWHATHKAFYMTELAIEKLPVDIDVKIKARKLLVWQTKAPTSQKASGKNHVCVFVNAKFMISFTFDTLAITSPLLSFLEGQGDLYLCKEEELRRYWTRQCTPSANSLSG